MNIKRIIDVCQVRQTNNLDCKKCSYIGSTCEHVKRILKVNKPFEYNNSVMLNKEEKKK